jgi:hypothetical protein
MIYLNFNKQSIAFIILTSINLILQLSCNEEIRGMNETQVFENYLNKYHNLSIPNEKWIFVSLPHSVGCKACSRSILHNLNNKDLSSNITLIVSSAYTDECNDFIGGSIIYDSLGIIERLPINTNKNSIIFCNKNKVDSIITFDARNFNYAESIIYYVTK